MAIIKFNKTFCQKAIELIKTKSSLDMQKANNDVKQIDNILMEYMTKGSYDQKTATKLNERLREEHKNTIKIIDAIPSPNDSMPHKKDVVESDPLIAKLMVDRFAILYNVLQKEGIVHTIKDFIERVD